VKDSRIVLSDLAVADILEQADWYESQADLRLARRWEQSVTSALMRIFQRPNTGALCKFRAEELKGTRRVPVTGFEKHLIFYQQVRKGELLILRVVHGARDLESLFS
jgi:plasmid stabilization system protein ParE